MITIKVKAIDKRSAGFTLLELILVVSLISVLLGMIAIRLGVVSYWKQESELKRLTQLLSFLHSQAVIDQVYYRLEFDFITNSYRVGVFQGVSAVSSGRSAGRGYLTDELAAFLSPSLAGDLTMIPPPTFPSLNNAQILPSGMWFEDIVTPRGKALQVDAINAIKGREPEKPFLLFSPKSFSEFGVLHLRVDQNRPVTILVNPWTGIPETFQEYKEFEWSLPRQVQQ